MKYKYLTLSTLAATALAVSAYGQATIYEGFEYPATNPDTSNNVLSGDGGATGTTGTWGGDSRLDVASGSLSFGSLSTSGNSAQYIGTGGGGGNLGIDVPTSGAGSLANAGLLADEGDLWFSILINFTDNGNDENAFTLGTEEPFTNNLSGGNGIGFYTSGPGSTQAAIYSGGTLVAATGSANFQAAGTQLIVGHVAWGTDASTADTLTLYNPGTDLDLTGMTSRRPQEISCNRASIASVYGLETVTAILSTKSVLVRLTPTYHQSPNPPPSPCSPVCSA